MLEKKNNINCTEIAGSCDKFRHLLIISGKGRVGALDVRAGDTVTLNILRGGEEKTVSITVTEDCLTEY